MRLTQAIQRAVMSCPNGIATVEADRQRTWHEVFGRVRQGASIFRSLNIQDGERVAVLADNSATYFELFHSVPWAGGVIVPINTRLTVAEISYILKDCEATCLVYSPAHRETAEAAAQATGIKHILSVDSPEDEKSYDARLSGAESVDDAGRGGSDLAAIYYTSGTTGQAKGVMLSHGNLAANALSILTYIPFNRTSVNIHAAPMFHLAALGIYPVTMVGGCHVFAKRVDAHGLIDAICSYNVTHCMTVPILIDRMAKMVAETKTKMPSLQMLGYGGSPISSTVLDRARRTWPEVDFIQGYGLTEAPSITFLGPDYHTASGEKRGKLRSAGEPIYSFEMAIRDPETGETLPANQTGEICARGPNVMQGYWNKPELTASVLSEDGWFRSGDAGHIDEDGFLTITDRIKDMIVTGGENVYSLEVENILVKHPDVDDCAVVGVPHPEWGEAVHAVIAPNAGANPDEDVLAEFCRERLATYKCPKSYQVFDGELPRTASGKIQKNILKKLL
ncbi:MAG: AMP-binding protein [Henriciella sp.]